MRQLLAHRDMNLDYKKLLEIANFTPLRIVEPYAWVGHIPFASWLIAQICPKVFVELGVHTGNSYFSICQTITELDLPVKSFAVDSWTGDEHAGLYTENIFEDVSKYNKKNYDHFSTLVRKRFDSAVNDFDDYSINLLHIDGLHTYDAVKHDFETWLPKLAPGAIVLFHDICEKRNGFEVWRLWEELTKKYAQNFAFTHSHGLGVIQVNLHDSPPQSSWALKEFGDVTSIRSFFEACGLRIQVKFQINQLEIDNDKFRSDVGKYHTLVMDRDQELSKLQKLNHGLNEKISEYHTLVMDRDQELSKVKNEKNLSIIEIGEYRNLAQTLRSRIDYIEGLFFWKVLSYCKVKYLFFKRAGKDARAFLNQYGFIVLVKKIILFAKDYGLRGLFQRVRFGRLALNLPATQATESKQNLMLPSYTYAENNYFNGVVDVIIPVYRGEDETIRCINSVISAKNKTNSRLIVINDCSPSQKIVDYLESLYSQEKILYLNNKKNKGFIYTVNRGMKLSNCNDVILLNSDTEVNDGWIDRLRYHEKNNNFAGTVTPFSNNATLCSFPSVDGSEVLPFNLPLSKINNAFWVSNKGRSIEIPTAVGFCMYISRRCIKDVGFFDQEAFGKGYGEENDFCMRAIKRGWKNLFALDLFVYHSGGVSFGEHANIAKINATKIILERYPDYDSRIQEYFSINESEPFRIAAAASLLKESCKPKILFISHKLGGGTEKHCDSLIKFYEDSAHILSLKILSSDEVELSLKVDDIEFRFLVNIKDSLDFLHEFLKSCGVSRIHIHHLMGSKKLMMQFLGKARIPFDLTIHDYYLICPRASLSLNGEYCGEPSNVDDCFKCLSTSPMSETQDIVTWRFDNLWLLQSAERVICPSKDVAQRISKYYSGNNIVVVPHEIIELIPIFKYQKTRKSDKLHIAVMGWLAPHKGLGLVREAVHLIEAENLAIQITLIGSSLGKLSNSSCYRELGPYDDSELDSIIAATNPNILWLPSTVPETFSYTLSAAMKTGRPIFASNLGAYGERLISYPSYELFSVKAGVKNILKQALDFSKKLEDN